MGPEIYHFILSAFLPPIFLKEDSNLEFFLSPLFHLISFLYS